ncbi:phosphonate C-P lyase system protein PhnH [Xanthobacter autotrophicus]|uniref:phosphonate C-P lyase system protein PhnH n=1 Tax=Xanthobacter autotrophicus TaxID=280 RepID=UPI0024A641C5|nr:phosphonate C-P lyase system protein PhnH [Xanthobacter autotrophicus]MDI4658685.1 phosphonate C-P lyase system protein PhnH [Xanthobacter autotrophicus]
MTALAPAPAMAPRPLAAGFADPVHDAQRTFAALMRAMAEPGRPVPLASDLAPPAPLSPEMAAAALALLDYETPVFLDATLAAEPDVAAFLRFHTGAPLVEDPAAARFALMGDSAGLPDFTRFAQGEPDYPDRSATLLIQVARMGEERLGEERLDEALPGAGALVLEGPGIQGRRAFAAVPLPADFGGRLAANRALYPLGIDLILCAPGVIAGLPRTLAPHTQD